MKRQRFDSKTKTWLLQEKVNGNWMTISKRNGTNKGSRKIGKWIGVPVTQKPQFRN
jgi:hypothetical protein